MNGVVLWSDLDDSCAVIWCEDHGDLAFYRRPADGASIPLDPGDWVQFDLTTERELRLARNPRLMKQGALAGLADRLTASARRPADAECGSARILPFPAIAKAARRVG